MTAPAVRLERTERIKRERKAAGLSPTITDPTTLRLVAALVARKGVTDGKAA